MIKTNFPNLKELLLSKNEISSIDVLSNVNYKKIKILTLNHNKINSIDCFENISFKILRELKLEKNHLKDIKILSKANFPKLRYLSLGDDTLGDNISELKNINFPKLEDIFVYLNEKINKKSNKVKEIVEIFENKGISFNFIKYDKSGENEIMKKDINFIQNYDDNEDEEEEDLDEKEANINNDNKIENNFNDFLLKEGLI